jgi:hypothetical protein
MNTYIKQKNIVAHLLVRLNKITKNEKQHFAKHLCKDSHTDIVMLKKQHKYMKKHQSVILTPNGDFREFWDLLMDALKEILIECDHYILHDCGSHVTLIKHEENYKGYHNFWIVSVDNIKAFEIKTKKSIASNCIIVRERFGILSFISGYDNSLWKRGVLNEPDKRIQCILCEQLDRNTYRFGLKLNLGNVIVSPHSTIINNRACLALYENVMVP